MERYNKFDVAKLQSISLSQYELTDILFLNLVLNVTLKFFLLWKKQSISHLSNIYITYGALLITILVL